MLMTEKGTKAMEASTNPKAKLIGNFEWTFEINTENFHLYL